MTSHRSVPLTECNAIIIAATIELERDALFCTLTLDFGSHVQGFGPIDMRRFNGSLFIQCILETVGVPRWSDLVGRPVRTKGIPGPNGAIVAIGHILRDEWFATE